MAEKTNPFLEDLPNLENKDLMDKYGICRYCGRMNFIIMREKDGNRLRCARCGAPFHEAITNHFRPNEK